jgi:predicted ArsR family transcriptional regulator
MESDMTQRSNSDEREISVFSASTVLKAVGEALSAIKRDDRLTYDDLGAILGKSDDQAAKYCDGLQEMGLVAYARGKREWNGRFTGPLDRLCEATAHCATTDRSKHSRVLRAALALAEALEDDGEISPAEVKASRKELEEARDAIEELLRKIVRAA